MDKRAKSDCAFAVILVLVMVAFVIAATALDWDSPTQPQDHERAIKESLEHNQ